jgi:hypothetical protein
MDREHQRFVRRARWRDCKRDQEGRYGQVKPEKTA